MRWVFKSRIGLSFRRPQKRERKKEWRGQDLERPRRVEGMRRHRGGLVAARAASAAA